MLTFTTPVQLEVSPFQLSPDSRVLTLGSCFAQHIADELSASLPSGGLLSNPFGLIYDARSMWRALGLLMSQEEFREETFFEFPVGEWHSLAHTPRWSSASLVELRDVVSKELAAARDHLKRSDLLILTLSTGIGFRHAESGIWASNCHKLPGSAFVQEEASFDELRQTALSLFAQLHERFPQLRVLLTLSPYRYRKYGLQRASADKARLRLLLHEVCEAQSWCCYFPAFEILMDELRDYRFYKPDMLHPSEQAVGHVWEQFSAWCFSPELRDFSQARRRILQQLAHRPLRLSAEEVAARELRLRSDLSALDSQLRG